MDRRAFLGLAGLVAASCAKDRSASSAAGFFLDKYYIEHDHQAALTVASGAAADRVKGELKMLEETRRQSGDIQSQVQPRVFYEKKSEKDEGSAATLEYEVKIDSGGMHLEKQVELKLERQGEAWKVTSVAESDSK